jgi:hypothetical protein
LSGVEAGSESLRCLLDPGSLINGTYFWSDLRGPVSRYAFWDTTFSRIASSHIRFEMFMVNYFVRDP